MRRSRLASAALLLAVAAVAAAYARSLPTSAACYAAGGAVDISHRLCGWLDGREVLLREVALRHGVAAGAALLAIGAAAHLVVRLGRRRSRPAG